MKIAVEGPELISVPFKAFWTFLMSIIEVYSFLLLLLLQGSKKLDKAEILEMTIEYLQRLQAQTAGGRGAGEEVVYE